MRIAHVTHFCQFVNFQRFSGMSVNIFQNMIKPAGFTYSGERFQKYFADFIKKYHFKDMYSGGFYPFETLGILVETYLYQSLYGR